MSISEFCDFTAENFSYERLVEKMRNTGAIPKKNKTWDCEIYSAKSSSEPTSSCLADASSTPSKQRVYFDKSFMTIARFDPESCGLTSSFVTRDSNSVSHKEKIENLISECDGPDQENKVRLIEEIRLRDQESVQISLDIDKTEKPVTQETNTPDLISGLIVDFPTSVRFQESFASKQFSAKWRQTSSYERPAIKQRNISFKNAFTDEESSNPIRALLKVPNAREERASHQISSIDVNSEAGRALTASETKVAEIARSFSMEFLRFKRTFENSVSADENASSVEEGHNKAQKIRDLFSSSESKRHLLAEVRPLVRWNSSSTDLATQVRLICKEILKSKRTVKANRAGYDTCLRSLNSKAKAVITRIQRLHAGLNQLGVTTPETLDEIMNENNKIKYIISQSCTLFLAIVNLLKTLQQEIVDKPPPELLNSFDANLKSLIDVICEESENQVSDFPESSNDS